LKRVFARYKSPPPGYRDATTFIIATIERGRTDGVVGVGDDMPIWGNRYGGPLTEQQVEDIVNYLISIQVQAGEEEAEAGPPDGQMIFAQFCASCHGPNGTGGQGPAMTGGAEVAQFPNIEDHVAFVRAGSKPGTTYGRSGRGTGLMPSWESSLSEAQIRAVVEYERSL
jgi:cbb3-type cytochrome c oxidase subunit III